MSKIRLTKTCMALLTAGIILTSKNFTNPRTVEVEEPLKGAILSSETENVNWNEISNTYDFVLINAGDGVDDDTKFEEYYQEAKEKDLDVGVMIINDISTYYRNTSGNIATYAERRYSHVKISQLLGKDINFPVYLRIDYGDIPIDKALPKEHINSLMNRYELIMRHNKFIPGIYTTEEVYQYIKSNVEDFDERFAHVIGSDKEIEMLKEVDAETPIHTTPLSKAIEEVTTNLNYNDRSLAKVPIILLTLDALACIGIQISHRNQRKAKEEIKRKIRYIEES